LKPDQEANFQFSAKTPKAEPERGGVNGDPNEREIETGSWVLAGGECAPARRRRQERAGRPFCFQQQLTHPASKSSGEMY
jgi:hypothetical protein